VLQRTRVAATGGSQHCDFGAGQVGQRVGLQIAPQILDRVEFRRVGREIKLAPTHYIDENRRFQTPMDLGPVPQQQQRVVKVVGKLLQKPQYRLGVEILVDQQLKVQPHLTPVGAQTQGGDRGDLLEVAPDMAQHWSLSAPTPGTAHHRQQEQPALVEENQPPLQVPGFFLIPGHSCLIQRWMRCSSRSNARRVGRCGVQPSDRSSRPI
jgi:hypothetical protein